MRAIFSVTALVAVGALATGSLATGSPGFGPVRTPPPDVQTIESPAGAGSAEGNLTVGPDGRVYLSWLEPAPDSAMALRFAAYDGTRWSATQTISSGRNMFVNWADFPSLAVLANGRLAAHWLQRHGPTAYAYDVRITTSADAGRTWGTPLVPHEDRSATEKGFVAFWPEGGAFGATWLDARKADKAGKAPMQEMQLFSTTIDASGRAAPETRLDDRVCDCCQTTAAVTADGPIVAYRDRTTDEIRDIYTVRRVSGRWTVPARVHADNWTINACPVNGPHVSANGRRVALAWYTGANSAPRVKVAFSSDAGATFGAPITVDEGNPAGRVATALLADGSVLVSWLERTGGDTASVRVRRVRESGAGPAVTVTASSAARASGFPRMARSGDRVYFAWTVPGRPSAVRVARANAADFR